MTPSSELRLQWQQRWRGFAAAFAHRATARPDFAHVVDTLAATATTRPLNAAEQRLRGMFHSWPRVRPLVERFLHRLTAGFHP